MISITFVLALIFAICSSLKGVNAQDTQDELKRKNLRKRNRCIGWCGDGELDVIDLDSFDEYNDFTFVPTVTYGTHPPHTMAPTGTGGPARGWRCGKFANNEDKIYVGDYFDKFPYGCDTYEDYLNYLVDMDKENDAD